MAVEFNIVDDFIDPALRLWSGEAEVGDVLRELTPVLEETGRQIFSNGSITVNLLPVLAAALALGALLLKLFFGLTLFDVMDAMTGSSYGHGYATDTTYSAPSTGYDAHAAYSARSSGYTQSETEVELTPEQRSLYPELAKLHDEITRLREAELQLKHEIFYNSPASSDLANAASGHIGYSY